MAPHLIALVQYWDGIEVLVSCPHCNCIHRHAFEGQFGARLRRKPQCLDPDMKSKGAYWISFPYYGENTPDERKGLGIRAGTVSDEFWWEHPPRLSVTLRGKRTWYETLEPMQRPVDGSWTSRLFAAVTHVSLGNTAFVSTYLESSTETDLFLYGINAEGTRRHDVDDEKWKAYQDSRQWSSGKGRAPSDPRIVIIKPTGQTVLHRAASQENVEMLELLLDRSVDVNAQTIIGRTPLMEAALWGRRKNVECLLKAGADHQASCVRFGRPLRAVDFAKDTPANRRERHARWAKEFPPHAEDTHKRDLDREAIVRMLDDAQLAMRSQTPVRSQIPVRIGAGGFRFTPISDNIGFVSLVATFGVPWPTKTIAVLFQDLRIDPLNTSAVAAMSGWTHPPSLRLNVQLAGDVWTKEVLVLCGTVGHVLPRDDRRDQGITGQFHACHAEKQLIAYFVSKNVPRTSQHSKRIEDDDDLGMLRLTLEDRQQGVHDCNNEKSDGFLGRITEGVIVASREVCSDCQEFVRRVNSKYGLRLSLH